MGLLDMLQGFSNNPAAQQGLLSAGLGMLAANQGGASVGNVVGRGGLLGVQAYGSAKQNEQAAQEQALKDEYMRQQMSQSDVETKIKVATFQQQQAQQEALNTAFASMAGGGQPGAQPGATGGAVSTAIAPLVGDAGAAPGGAPPGGMPPAPGGMPPGPGSTVANPFGAAPGSATAGAMAAPQGTPQAGAPGQPGAPSAQAAGIIALMQRLPPIQRDAAMADIKFNGGKNLPDFFKGKITVTPAGAMVNENTGEIVGYAPVMDTGTGRAYQLHGGTGGQPASVAALPGSMENFKAGETAKADIASQHDLKEVTDLKTGVKRYASAAEIQANPDLRVTERSPEVSQALQLGNKGFYDDDYTPTVKEGRAALGDIQAVQALRSIPVESGWGKETQAGAASFLASLGVPGAEKMATNAQQFQSVAMSKLNDNLKQQSGPQTEGDAQRAGKTFSSLANTPRANAFIQDYAEAQALLKQKKAEYYAKSLPYAQQRGDLAEIGRRWQKIAPSVWTLGNMAQYAPKGQ
jgi:hypothetical protein